MFLLRIKKTYKSYKGPFVRVNSQDLRLNFLSFFCEIGAGSPEIDSNDGITCITMCLHFIIKIIHNPVYERRSNI